MNEPMLTDWLLVGVTAVYAIITVFILCANSKAAKATKAQVEESKRQFEETQRLQAMPYLKVEIEDCEYCVPNESEDPYETIKVLGFNRSDIISDLKKHIKLTNVGTGTLHQTNIIWDTVDSTLHKEFGRNMIIPPQTDCGIDIYFATKKYGNDLPLIFDQPKCKLTIEYMDILGNKYCQSLEVLCFITEDGLDHIDYSQINAPSLIETVNS